jgi:hypothetical protein
MGGKNPVNKNNESRGCPRNKTSFTPMQNYGLTYKFSFLKFECWDRQEIKGFWSCSMQYIKTILLSVSWWQSVFLSPVTKHSRIILFWHSWLFSHWGHLFQYQKFHCALVLTHQLILWFVLVYLDCTDPTELLQWLPKNERWTLPHFQTIYCHALYYKSFRAMWWLQTLPHI